MIIYQKPAQVLSINGPVMQARPVVFGGDWWLSGGIDSGDVVEYHENLARTHSYSGDTLTVWSVFFRFSPVTASSGENIFDKVSKSRNALKQRVHDQEYRYDTASQIYYGTGPALDAESFRTTAIVCDGTDSKLYIDGSINNNSANGHSNLTNGLEIWRYVNNATHYALYSIDISSYVSALHNAVM